MGSIELINNRLIFIGDFFIIINGHYLKKKVKYAIFNVLKFDINLKFYNTYAYKFFDK